ncbi:hypothetical protein DAPPUDRAFT_279037 [Daphnia pulex]|uniref:Uncharacterized protein n=1 Tax=Daphnia pulex TaxID=6669 RepID=E9I767_DAPPU|nr:hypothetical protein DAPPUDRAFT_279037 [Daphnia pulex]|eukprot:EFX60163.1 hypothetical protein DAPPUDRAFT_279037 [Daphnia pulex]
MLVQSQQRLGPPYNKFWYRVNKDLDPPFYKCWHRVNKDLVPPDNKCLGPPAKRALDPPCTGAHSISSESQDVVPDCGVSVQPRHAL